MLAQFWYLNLNKKFKSKLQTIQNKCNRYCLPLNRRSHIGVKEFEKLNLFPVSERFNQYLCSVAFNFFSVSCPLCLNDICKQLGQVQANTRYWVFKLKQPSRNAISGQKTLSFLTSPV